MLGSCSADPPFPGRQPDTGTDLRPHDIQVDVIAADGVAGTCSDAYDCILRCSDPVCNTSCAGTLNPSDKAAFDTMTDCMEVTSRSTCVTACDGRSVAQCELCRTQACANEIILCRDASMLLSTELISVELAQVRGLVGCGLLDPCDPYVHLDILSQNARSSTKRGSTAEWAYERIMIATVTDLTTHFNITIYDEDSETDQVLETCSHTLAATDFLLGLVARPCGDANLIYRLVRP